MRLRWFFVISIVGATLTALAVIGVESLPGYFWHPEATGTGSTCSAVNHTGCGYSLWSGISGSWVTTAIQMLLTWAFLLVLYYQHHVCHKEGCWRISWHTHPEHGHPVCKKHHPDNPKDL